MQDAPGEFEPEADVLPEAVAVEVAAQAPAAIEPPDAAAEPSAAVDQDEDEPQSVEAAPAQDDGDEPEAEAEADAFEAEASSEEAPVEVDDEAESFGNVESIEPSQEEEDDDEPEVTTLGGSGSEETEMRALRPRSDDEGEPVEVVGGDAMDETPRRAPRLRRQYKIQEVIKRRQVLLVQVVKEERGNKGAALTTYLSLAGRYSVLMPNTARGGGISRKITNAQDRSRLKSIAEELDVPEGMGVILRTAGASRTKQEVKRDFEYLLRMWETVRETTLASTAPMLVYEEGSLIKRAIRDLYGKDVDEIIVAGEAAYREARAFMRLLMPNHVKAVDGLSRHPAGIRQGGRRSAARRDVLQPGHAEVRRLYRDQPDRGPGGDRRQLGPFDARAQYRGHRATHQFGGGRRDRAPAQASRPRRADRRRLHRHGGVAQQSRRRAAHERGAQERSSAHPGRAHLAFRPSGNVAPAHPHRRARRFDGAVPALPRRRRCALDLVDCAACAAGARRRSDQVFHPRYGSAHPHAGRALHSQSEARATCAISSAGSASPSSSRPTTR